MKKTLTFEVSTLKVYGFIALGILLATVYVGEVYQPYKITGDIASYAMAKVTGQANQVELSKNVKTHQDIVLSKNESTSKPIRYVVKKGDTLIQLSRTYGTRVSYIARLSKISVYDKLKPGQVLVIPPPNWG